MNSPDRSKHFFEGSVLLWVSISAFLVAGVINQQSPMPRLQLSKQQTAVNINKSVLLFLSAGNSRLLTDLLWVQTLLESDLEHYAGKDLNSWMYLRFSTIAALDPLFYENYAWGGQYLSIVKDDLLGAVNLLKLGLRHYPDDYRLNYQLGFTYYFELGDSEQGLKYMEKVAGHPRAPKYFQSIVLKLRHESGGDINATLALIYDLMTSTNDKYLRERLQKDFYALKAQRDLTCLNSGKSGCETLDAQGVPYRMIYGRYHSQTPFVPYNLKRRGDPKKSESVTTF